MPNIRNLHLRVTWLLSSPDKKGVYWLLQNALCLTRRFQSVICQLNYRNLSRLCTSEDNNSMGGPE